MGRSPYALAISRATSAVNKPSTAAGTLAITAQV